MSDFQLGPPTGQSNTFLDNYKPSSSSETKALVRSIFSTGAKAIPIIGTLVEIIQGVDDALREEKIELLMTSFAAKFESVEEAVGILKTLTTSKEGAVLLKKVIHVLDNGDVEEEWIKVLASVLKKVTESDLREHFREIAYVLSQIDRLTPQALIILSKFTNWSRVRLHGTTTTSQHTTCGDWEMQIVTHWTPELDAGTRVRMAHSFRELLSAGMIKLNGERMALEPIGDELFRYIA